MITHTSNVNTSSDESAISSEEEDGMVTNQVAMAMDDMQLTQVEFEAFPPADEDWDGVRTLVDRLFQGVDFDKGYLSQTIIDNYKVGTVIKGADIEVGEDDPVFAIASILPLRLCKDEKKLKQFISNILEKCTTDDKADIARILESPDTALLINAKFSNLPLEITAQLYKALKMELMTERKENEVYNISNFVVVGNAYTEPVQRKRKKAKVSEPDLKYQDVDMESFAEVASHAFSWRLPDETLAPLLDSTAHEVMQGYRSVIIVPLDKFLKGVDKLVDELTAG